MSITEEEAVRVARAQMRFDERRYVWIDSSIVTYPGKVEGCCVWIVQVEHTDPSEGEPWMRTVWAPIRYFVDQGTGEYLGFALERGEATLYREGQVYLCKTISNLPRFRDPYARMPPEPARPSGRSLLTRLFRRGR